MSFHAGLINFLGCYYYYWRVSVSLLLLLYYMLLYYMLLYYMYYMGHMAQEVQYVHLWLGMSGSLRLVRVMDLKLNRF